MTICRTIEGLEKGHTIKKGRDRIEKWINEGRKSSANTIPKRINLDKQLISSGDIMKYYDILKYTDKGGLTFVLRSNINVTLKSDNRIPSTHATCFGHIDLHGQYGGTDKICCG